MMKIKKWTPLSLSVLTTLSLFAAHPTPLIAQTLSLFAAHPTPLIAQTPALGDPVTTVPVAQEGITIRLVNQTTDPITYEALGDTQPRRLTPTADTTLQQLNTPATLTFFYEDIPKDRQAGVGLLQTVISFDETTGVLDIFIRPTNDLDVDVSNLTVEANGNVFVI